MTIMLRAVGATLEGPEADHGRSFNHTRCRPTLRPVRFFPFLALLLRDVMAQDCLISVLGSVTSFSYRSIFV
jgi:hypothetical protein